MPDQEIRGLRITPDWRVSLLALLILPVLMSLGFWQLDRADEKRQLQNLYEQRQLAGFVSLEDLLEKEDLQYQPVTFSGEYINGKAILLDNRIYRGRFGYEIITPFKLKDSDLIILVNRGWLEGDSSRRTLPAIKVISGSVELTGEIYVPQGEGFVLSDKTEAGNSWPRVVQTLDVNKLLTEFELPVFNYTVRLSNDSPGSFQPNWVVVNLQPAKHTGYAVQWFAMSFTLLVIAIMANTNCWLWIKTRKNRQA